MYDYYTYELYHYGVKGMKWGVRRYQNKDGSLTAAGKKRVVESGTYLFPKYDRKKKQWKGPVKNRLAVAPEKDREYDETVTRERDRILNDRNVLKKAGYKFTDNPDSDVREHNNDLLSRLVMESPTVKEAHRKHVERFVDEYADATLADLGLVNTKQAKEFVKEHLTTSSSYIQNVLNDK